MSPIRITGEKLQPSLPFDVLKLIDICRQNDVSMLGLFGWMARGDATEQIDAQEYVNTEPSAWGGTRTGEEDVAALRAEVDASLARLKAVSGQIEELTKGNEALRQEIADLRRQLAQESSSKPA